MLIEAAIGKKQNAQASWIANIVLYAATVSAVHYCVGGKQCAGYGGTHRQLELPLKHELDVVGRPC